ncbi:unnamed protein product [Discula destructiva]
MCNRSLNHQETEDYADGDTLSTHISHSLNHTIDALPNFIRCPRCPSGQLHEDAHTQPIVHCAACATAFCFAHRIPLVAAAISSTSLHAHAHAHAHGNMSCAEYDAYLADPRHFRSAFEREQERARIAASETAAVARAQQRVERVMAQRRALAQAEAAREDGERAAQEREKGRERERERERQDQQAMREAAECAERARVEEGKYREARAREARERELAAVEVERRKLEDLHSERTAMQITKVCPACMVRIEKNEGCMHMACRCGYQFCWECLGPWSDDGCRRCFGGGGGGGGGAVQFF